MNCLKLQGTFQIKGVKPMKGKLSLENKTLIFFNMLFGSHREIALYQQQISEAITEHKLAKKNIQK